LVAEQDKDRITILEVMVVLAAAAVVVLMEMEVELVEMEPQGKELLEALLFKMLTGQITLGLEAAVEKVTLEITLEAETLETVEMV
jgi:hypothetical protein